VLQGVAGLADRCADLCSVSALLLSGVLVGVAAPADRITDV